MSLCWQSFIVSSFLLLCWISLCWLSFCCFSIFHSYTECRYAKICYSECHYTENCHAKCRYAESSYNERLVAVKKLCSKDPTIEAAKFILNNKGAIVEKCFDNRWRHGIGQETTNDEASPIKLYGRNGDFWLSLTFALNPTWMSSLMRLHYWRHDIQREGLICDTQHKWHLA